MGQLPGEILLEIFMLLHPIDKVECMKVCRKWEDTIRDFCLFHTVCISSHRQIELLLKKLKKEPSCGELVERVFFFGEEEMASDIVPLLPYFPNAREVCLPTLYLTEENAKSEPFEKWANSIKYLNEYRGMNMIPTLLGSHVFSRLETLYVYENKENIFGLRDIVAILPNLPVLKELTLESFEMHIDIIEALHNAGPFIESLFLKDAKVHDNYQGPKVISSMNIQPVISLKSFEISISSLNTDMEYLTTLFEYMGIKYPNLEQLKLPVLTHNIDKNERRALCTDIFIPLCQKMGSQLKTLRGTLFGEPKYTFQWMEKANCQIQDLDLEVSHSNWSTAHFDHSTEQQLTCIEKMTLRHLKCLDFQWLKYCIVLKELRLIFPQKSRKQKKQFFKMDHLISDLPPTVTAIMIEQAEIYFNKDKKPDPLPQMKKLEFWESELADGLDKFISDAFPQLQVLKLKFCKASKRTFICRNLCLFSLDIDDLYIKRKMEAETLLVKTSDTNEKRLYKKMRLTAGADSIENRPTRYNQSSIYSENKQLYNNLHSEKPLITFECASVKNIIY